MNAPRATLKKIGAIMLHDATLTSFQVLSGGQVLLRFHGVSVYRSIAPELENIWIHNAALSIEGVTEILVQGPAWTKGDDDYILDDTIINNHGEEIHWLDIGRDGIQKIELVIFSGARIKIMGSRATLKLSRKRELAGQWKGPLISPSAS